MKPKLYLTLAVCFLFLMTGTAWTLASGPTRSTSQFTAPCGTLPFEDIKEKHPIDDECDIEGMGSDLSRLQNRAKNNFCATGTPVAVTRTTFIRLQQAADKFDKSEIPWGSGNSLPPDRSKLKGVVTVAGKKLGEGTVVTFVGFILSARNSNVSKGESVNCKKGGKANNDIHIELGNSPSADECSAVSAEITPHFRPAAWEEIVDFDHDPHPFKFTGQLFFDASHVPCRPGKRANPARASVWEVHPVYSIEVCKNKTLAGCPANDASKWTPFDKLVGPDDEDGGR